MMKEEGNMLGLSPGLRDHPFPGLLPGFARGLSGLPHSNGLPLPTPPNGPANPALPNMWPFIWSHISNLLPQLSISRMDPLSQVFSLRWTHHQSNMLTIFDKLLASEAFTDVTLACDGGSIKCHKIVLAASSDYFQKLFMDSASEHPIVFLKDVKADQIRAILDYMYKGEVSVAQDELPALLRVAEMLKVKGMIEDHRNIDRKDILTRTSSPGSAPPNSIVPPNGDSGGLTIPPPSKTPTSAGLPPPPHGAIPPNFRPFLTPPGASSTPPFPMWPLPGLFPGAHNLFGRHEERREVSPGPAHGRDRAKMSSGSSSDKEVPLPPLIPREAATEPQDSKPGYEKETENYEKSPRNYNDKMEGIAGYVPAQRLEWKRYKQYTRNDIMAAIEEVKKGKSALQVSKKFNIPSRTLYDKVKKMGITTGRQQQRKSMNNTNYNAYSAAFPSLNMMSGISNLHEGISQLDPYKSLMERMKDEERPDPKDVEEKAGSEGGPRKDLGPMPFSILPPHMLNMMERMKSEGGEREREERESSPINLSSERDEKRMSEGSFAHSPSPGSTDLTTSPSNCPNSPPGARDSPDRQQIDIRAQFLADLRRLDARGRGGEGGASPDLELSQDNLPPRKRKVSHETDGGESAAKLVESGHKALNGLESENRADGVVN